MSRTRRRKPWYPKQMDLPGKDRWRKIADDSTCRPGCIVCGKFGPFKRLAKRQEKQQWRRIVEEQLLAEYDVPTPKSHMKRASRWW